MPRSIAAPQVNPPGNRFLLPIACQRDIAAGYAIHKDGLYTFEQGLDTDEWQGVRRVRFLIDASHSESYRFGKMQQVARQPTTGGRIQS